MTQAPQIAIYVLCLLASGMCTWMLMRGYIRNRTRLLLWAGFCFALLCVNNLAVLLDILVFPEADLQAWRHAASLSAVAVLLVGLVWESE